MRFYVAFRNKRIIWLTALVLLSGTIGFFLLKKTGEKRIIQLLENLLNAEDESFRCTLGTLEVLPDKAGISIKDIRFQYTDPTAEQAQAVVEIKKLSILNITPSEFIIDQKIKLGTITIDSCFLIWLGKNLPKNKVKNSPSSMLDQQKRIISKIQEKLESIQIDRVQINSFFVFQQEIEEKKSNRKPLLLRDLRMEINNIRLDELGLKDSSRYFFAQSIFMTSAAFQMPIAEGNYHLHYDSLQIQINSRSQLSAWNVHLVPSLTEAQHEQQQKTAERMECTIPNIELHDLQTQPMLRFGIFEAAALVLKNPKVQIFKNKSIDQVSSSKEVKFPHQWLRRLSNPISVSKIQLQNGEIVYRELGKQFLGKAEVAFSKVNATIHSVNGEDSIVAEASALLLQKIQIQTVWHFWPKKPRGDFKVSGYFKPFSLRALNTVSKNLGGISFEAGEVSKFHFSILGNDAGSRVKSTFLYQNLKFNLLKKEEEEWKSRKLLTFMANQFLVPNKNKKGKEFVRLSYRREEKKSLFNLVWKSLFSVMKSCMGIEHMGKDADRINDVEWLAQ